MAIHRKTVQYPDVAPGAPYVDQEGVYVGPSGTVTMTTGGYSQLSKLDMHLVMTIDGKDLIKIPNTEITNATGADPAAAIARGLTPGLKIQFVVTDIQGDRAAVDIFMLADG